MRILVRNLEKVIIAIAVPAVFLATLPGSGRAVFMGPFNNIDGSLLAARAVSALAGLVLVIAVGLRFFPARLEIKPTLRFLSGSLGLLVAVSLAEWGLRFFIQWLFNLPLGPDTFSDKELAFPVHESLSPAIIPRNLLICGVGLLYGIGRDWVLKSRKHGQLEKEKMRAEIALLRSQINPHYFFNALNNIYAVTQRNEDEEAGRAILKLSETMRYMVYDSDSDRISLKKEIDHIRNTIEVFRLRFAPEDHPDIRFRTEGDLDSIAIAPMLLLPFVENAMKHGLNSLGRGRVDIEIRRDGAWLDVRVENERWPAAETVRKHPGIGLANVRKRLDWLYPRTHVLTIREDDRHFRVHLRLKHKE